MLLMGCGANSIGLEFHGQEFEGPASAGADACRIIPIRHLAV
jgi:hypothetical protein